jgi:predicted nuclease of predicted toxin-antitoxin system
MRPIFLADHNLNNQIITGLLDREPSMRFFRAREVGLARAPDEAVLDYAATHSMIVVSHDVNTMIKSAYARITSQRPFPGLMIAQETDPVADAINELLLIWHASEAEEWEGRIVFLPL